MQQADQSEAPGSNGLLATGSAVYLQSINALFSNIQPLLLGALAGAYGFRTGQLGHFTAAFVGASALCNLTSPLWIGRVNWRVTAIGATLTTAAVLAASSLLKTPAFLPIVFARVGICNGLSSSPSFASLGEAKNPERAYGAATVGQSVCVAAVSGVISNFVAPQFGLSGFLLALAVIMATGVVAGLFLPASSSRSRNGKTAAAGVSIFSAKAVPALIALLALFLFLLGSFLYYYFVERIGAARGLPISLIGTILSFAALSTLPTSMAVTVWGGKVPAQTFLLWGTILLIACCGVLVATGVVPYAGSVVLFGLGYGLSQPSYWAVLRNSDFTNRLHVAAPAALGVAGVGASLSAGPITEAYGFPGLEAASTLMITSAAVCAWLAARLHAARSSGA